MKTIKGILIIVLIFILTPQCTKDSGDISLVGFELEKCQILNSNIGSDVDLYFALVNKKNEVINSFNSGDDISFKFYLKNNTSSDLTYSKPCSELLWPLHVYKQKDNQTGIYDFVGQPSMQCVMVAVYAKLKANSAVELGNIPINGDLQWPEMNSGSYYVGDSITLSINSQKITFSKRIYFDIL